MIVVNDKSYRGLWSAVILQTFSDLKPKVFPTHVPRIKDTGDPKKNAEQIRKAYAKREVNRRTQVANRAYARRWIASNSRKPATFLWICDCLDLDPKLLREIATDPKRIDQLLAGDLL